MVGYDFDGVSPLGLALLFRAMTIGQRCVPTRPELPASSLRYR